MRRFRACLWFCFVVLVGSPLVAPARGDEIAERAKKLHFSSIVLDTHDDTERDFLFDLDRWPDHGPARGAESARPD